MKTTEIRSGSSVSTGRKKAAGAARGGNFDAILGSTAGSKGAGSAPVAATSPLASVIAPTAVEAADADGRRRRAYEYGEDLLDQLEALRRAILLGRIDVSRLRTMLASIRERSERSNDPGIDEILAEIELRVEVEAAKLSR
jgi:hypothetical protein